jgi:DNA-binding NarL/FixJ family response regulator
MQRIRVISIDDHPLIHEAIKSLLADYEHIELVGGGYVGDHLFPLMEEYRPDVVILDLMMPQHENDRAEGNHFVSLQALAELRQRFPDTAVIILSQFLHKGIAQGAIEHGVKGYLLKSDNLSLNLPAAIEQVNKGGVYFSTAFSQEMFKTPDRSNVELLTERQREVILAIAKSPESTYAEIAEQLHIEPRTIKGHLGNIYPILGVTNITACIIRCMQLGIIPSPVESGVYVSDL